MRLKDKVAIVTGGGSGIGRGIALLFAQEGAKVVVVGRRKEPLDETVREIEKANGTAFAFSCDVSKLEDVQSAVEKTISQFGSLDILINNAGVFLGNDVVSESDEQWEKVIAIDLKGTWLFSKTALPHMLKKGKGKIVNVASVAGLVGFEKCAAYCAAKGGIVNLTRQMALDFGPQHVNVNAVAPGVIETDMTRDFLTNEQAKQSFLLKTPIKRIGKPEDIAFACLYLSSNESDFVTGHTLVVDGGWIIS